MKTIITVLVASLLAVVSTGYAGDLPTTQISRILDHKASLGLTDDQVKKLEIINKNAIGTMVEAKGQANIRLQEIEKFTSNWTNLNGAAVRELIKEYYDYLSRYKEAEVNAIIQARSVLKQDQLNRYQQIASIDALILQFEGAFALK